MCPLYQIPADMHKMIGSLSLLWSGLKDVLVLHICWHSLYSLSLLLQIFRYSLHTSTWVMIVMIMMVITQCDICVRQNGDSRMDRGNSLPSMLEQKVNFCMKDVYLLYNNIILHYNYCNIQLVLFKMEWLIDWLISRSAPMTCWWWPTEGGASCPPGWTEPAWR